MFIDAQGNEFSKKYARIISLVPSLTELLYDLGLGDRVAGITKFCVHPDEWFRTKVRIGGTKNLNLEKIHQLQPDLIIANKEENVKEQVEELAEKYDILLTDVNNLDEALAMILDVGTVTRTAAAAAFIHDRIIAGFSGLQAVVQNRARPRVAYFIWKDPYMVAGCDTFIDDMIGRCGFQNVFQNKQRYPEIRLHELPDLNCQTVLLSSEPYPFKEKEGKQLQEILPGISIKYVDGEMFSWYGSRLIAAADYFKTLRKPCPA